jgi:transposase
MAPSTENSSPSTSRRYWLYVEKILAPTLAKGDVVILDNLGSHKGRAARRAVRQAGAHMLFLPPYSPDLNPIEQLFAKLKHLIRMAEPRTVEATWRKVGQILDLFAPDECANYLKNSGYASVRKQHALAGTTAVITSPLRSSSSISFSSTTYRFSRANYPVHHSACQSATGGGRRSPRDVEGWICTHPNAETAAVLAGKHPTT